MLRILSWCVIAALLLVLAWFIGNLPGTVIAHSGSYTVETSVPAAILLLAVIVFLLTALARGLGGVRRSPGRFSRWRGGRRRQLGDIATQRGIVALAAGDGAAAATEAKRAQKLLGDTPMVLLLVAESARLAGRHEEAAAAFTKLTAHKDMAFLGHRGLMRHSLAAGAHDDAASHALSAADTYPNSPWLQTKRRDIAVARHDWPAALALSRGPMEIGALATAAANDAANSKTALRFAKQAVKAAPALGPAVVAYAEALRRAGQHRKAGKILRNGWARTPQPMIAQSYLAPVTAPIERAQAAAELAAANPGHAESELLLAQTSLEAKLTGEARRHAEAAIKAGLHDGRANAVLASLDGGGSALVVAAPPAAAWECSECHSLAGSWQPACPNCAKVGTLARRVPGTALA